MGKSFIKRLRIPLGGSYKLPLYSTFGTLIAKGYSRVVIGQRGPYVEFNESQIFLKESFTIPEIEKYRLTNNICFYVEYRSTDESNIKLYFQKRRVKYADYKIGMYYISPFDLKFDNGMPIID